MKLLAFNELQKCADLVVEHLLNSEQPVRLNDTIDKVLGQNFKNTFSTTQLVPVVEIKLFEQGKAINIFGIITEVHDNNEKEYKTKKELEDFAYEMFEKYGKFINDLHEACAYEKIDHTKILHFNYAASLYYTKSVEHFKQK